MKKGSPLKKYGVLFLLFCMLGISTYYSLPVTTVSASEVQPRSDSIGWRYKEVNGKKYKRLYNYTTASWIGDWIPTGF